ncbi:MAG: cell envelope biogenesis protein TolA [Lachnospiraceae bacterium]|nr:cell envelope biogenesis protein TolA [Lachnospiraceae bacterium]
MTRERLTKELEKVRLQIAKLQEKEKVLAAEKEKADMEASKAIIEKKKIEPEVLKALCDLKEQEIREILERRKKNEENKGELN